MPALRQSSPHAVWSIAEVVREVMEQNAENVSTLSSCARVSHAFSEPALEVLWREQSGLNRLLSILRKSVKCIPIAIDNMPGFTINRYVISGPIDDLEWSRFQLYANLVRAYSTSIWERMDDIFVATLLDKCAGKPLLPRLTFLGWTGQDDGITSSAFLLFMSPMLRIVHVNSSGLYVTPPAEFEPLSEEFTIAAALRLIHARAPAVEQLKIPACHLCSLKPISDFVHLRSLCIESEDPRIWEKIANWLPNLQDLTVYMFTQMQDEDIQRARRLPEAHFGQLTRLWFMADPRIMPIVLDLIRAPHLNNLQLDTELRDDLCVHLCDIVAVRFVRSLRIFLLKLASDGRDEHPRQFEALFSPLYAIRHLEHVTVQVTFDTNLALTADEVTRITGAWPNLKHLKFSSVLLSKSELAAPRMPITALEIFARRCPQLEVLFMPLPNPAPLADLDLATVPACSNRLQRIYLYSGSEWPEDFADWEKVEPYVERLFPGAVLIHEGL
ncbi:hypothetical protein L226DRAFT_612237 [Lentinus tigrinus ALCF2SS1-7]|uniref:F-box domain-containing protein n=1 Tax=Lentinus tigrinus ALCF2SS1-6 TaxID=1328759 RepID=A0A5C2SDA7_9APHY|nr:hypothetical protein L227DRAFT_524248 [Lentinus tigrinus ALCF2SS1-6]RPD75979.1 hypothetical protein L226DRAFT_612237 [Lentinus tigrinus ALCF2SS1-7]